MQIKRKNNNSEYREEIRESNNTEQLDLTSITSILMAAKVNFHLLHFQTTSFSKHLALEELYKGVTKLADPIIECLLGRLNTRLSSNTVVTCVPFITGNIEQDIINNTNNIAIFASNLFKWSSDNNYQDIANLAAELEQLISNTKYKYSLK